MKYLILFVIILIVFLLYKKFNSKKVIEKKVEVKEPKVSFVEIKKSTQMKENGGESNLPYNFLISSLTKRDNTLELLISIENHTEKTTRIDLKEAIYFSTELQHIYKADVTFYGELSMGTNDILLKNTILPDSHVIRNIYFFNHDFKIFDEMDYIEIKLEINQEFYTFKQFLHESNIKSVKFIQKS